MGVRQARKGHLPGGSCPRGGRKNPQREPSEGWRVGRVWEGIRPMLASLLAKPTLFLDPQCSLAASQPPPPSHTARAHPTVSCAPGISVCIYKHTLLSDMPLGHVPDGST